MLPRFMSRFSVENFFSHSTEKLRRGTLLCFTKILVSKTLMDKRGEGRKGVSQFSVELVGLTVPKNFVGNPSVLCFRNFPVAKKFMDEQGGVSRFSVKNFLSHSAENFRMCTVYCVINFGYRKNLCFRGLCHDFPSTNFCLTVPKPLVEELSMLCFRKYLVAIKFMDKREGEISRFHSKILCLYISQCQKVL